MQHLKLNLHLLLCYTHPKMDSSLSMQEASFCELWFTSLPSVLNWRQVNSLPLNFSFSSSIFEITFNTPRKTSDVSLAGAGREGGAAGCLRAAAGSALCAPQPQPALPETGGSPCLVTLARALGGSTRRSSPRTGARQDWEPGASATFPGNSNRLAPQRPPSPPQSGSRGHISVYDTGSGGLLLTAPVAAAILDHGAAAPDPWPSEAKGHYIDFSGFWMRPMIPKF